MKIFNNKKLRLLLLVGILASTLALMSGCSTPQDSVEDPLSKYSGMGVSAQVPFDTNEPEPTQWEPEYTEAPATVAPTVTGYQDLTFGTTGEAVSALQGRLKALSYYNGVLDGKFGESTTSAIKLFQGQLGVQKTGLATASLQEMLFSTSAPKYMATTNLTEAPYMGPEGEAPDDYEDYSLPTIAKKPTTSGGTSSTPNYNYQEETYDDEPTDLARGDKGLEVEDLQRALKSLGYYTGTIDGDYGSATVSAVKRFQKMYGQNQTGVASVTLQNKLNSGNAVRFIPDPTPMPTPSPKPTAEYSTLEWGESGSAVTRLQKRLRALGFMTKSASGEYDDATEKAVSKFQKAIGVSETGVATASVQKKLFASSAPTFKPTTTPTPEPVEPEYKKLEPGNTGAKVKALQKRLKTLGYFDGEVGGNYLTLTADAVKLFQKALGLKQTGIATVALQRELFSNDAPKYKPKATATPKPTESPKPSSKYTKLTEGSNGKAVEKLQERLKKLGFYSSKVTGGYGKNTTSAVKAFQKAADLQQTGIATASLQKLIFSNEAPNKKSPVVPPADEPKYSKLKNGSTGDNVKALQRRLKDLGYFDGDIGGNYLTKTTTAVKAFQKALGVKQDGIATTDLQEKLFSDSAPSKSSGSKTNVKALMYKDTGSGVQDLQIRLIELGFLSEDYGSDKKGTYGKSTRQAVIDAQLARGYDSDGNSDVEFLKYILSSEADELSVEMY